MNRIENRLAELKKKGEKAFITYVTAGFPNLEKTKEIIKVQEEAGTDIIELGVPFSDPVADGPVIQDASYRSILGGTTLKKVFQMVEELRKEEVRLPIVFMLYYNTVVFYGVDAFAKECERVGVDGLIIPDLPLEEQGEIKQALLNQEETLLLQLVSPVSKQRIPQILDGARGFVYCVSSMGVTGQAGQFHREVKNYLEEVKKEAKIPVMMGFGIRTAKDVAPLRDCIDGAIVGSHFIHLLEENNFDMAAVREYCSTFKQELNER